MNPVVFVSEVGCLEIARVPPGGLRRLVAWGLESAGFFRTHPAGCRLVEKLRQSCEPGERLLGEALSHQLAYGLSPEQEMGRYCVAQLRLLLDGLLKEMRCWDCIVVNF
jgi:hypothetical protein